MHNLFIYSIFVPTINVIFGTMKFSDYSEQQLEQAKLLEAVILRIRDGKESITPVFKESNLPYKSKTYYYLKSKYEKDGLIGLISKINKRGCKAPDEKEKIQNYIIKQKQKHPSLRGKEIRDRVLKKFNISYTVSNINLLIQQENLEVERGRPAIEKKEELTCAGAFILIAAIMETGFIKHLLQAQQEIVSDFKEQLISAEENNTASPSLCGTKQERGIFSKDEKGKFQKYESDSEEDYKNNGFISSKFLSVKNRIQTRNLNRLDILNIKEPTIYRKNLTLLLLPIFTNHSRLVELDDTLGNELTYLAGYDYKSSTIDKYLREMKYLQWSGVMLDQIARFWCRFWESKTGKPIKQICYYFDGYTKPLWSDYRVKQGKVTMMGRVMGCLEQVYVHSDRGYPIMFQTFSGNVHLPDAIKKLHTQIDKILPERVSRISVFDAGGNSVDFYETFGDDNYFICILNNNQYKQDLSNITVTETIKIDGEVYKEAEKQLKNSKTKQFYKARIVLYKKVDTDRYIAFVTNTSIGELSTKSVVDTYYKRWPNQEHSFRDMNGGVHLSTNYGFGKTPVINIVVQNNKEELAQKTEVKQDRIKKLSETISELKQQQELIVEQTKQQQKEIELQIKEIEKKLTSTEDKKQTKSLLRELKQLYKRSGTIQKKLLKNEIKTKISFVKLQGQKKREETLYNKQKAEFERISKKEFVYENDVELDQLLSNYKISFANLCGFVLKEYFPELNITLEKLIVKVFKRPGRMITKGNKKEIMIYLNKKDEKMSKLITGACEIINKKKIKLYDNTSLKLVPMMRNLK